MPIHSIPGKEAWESALRNRSARWSSGKVDKPNPPESVATRLKKPVFLPKVQPKFLLSAADTFFCIGSCFARNIEEHLIYNRIAVLSKRVVVPRAEWPDRPGGMFNKFMTPSILNELRWSLDGQEFPDGSIVEAEDGWIDLQLAQGAPGVSKDRAFERRRWTREYFARISNATVLVITLGLIETWYDNETGIYLNGAPSYWIVKRNPNRYSLHILDAADNTRMLEDMRDILRRTTPNCRMIVTVSPVPMGLTFSQMDVSVANTYSKSVLRAAAGSFAMQHSDVDYYPAYETATLSRRQAIFSPVDEIHVVDRAVGIIIREFIKAYFPDVEPATTEFHETKYLLAHPAVEEAVRRGELESGFEHWLRSMRSAG